VGRLTESGRKAAEEAKALASICDCNSRTVSLKTRCCGCCWAVDVCVVDLAGVVAAFVLAFFLILFITSDLLVYVLYHPSLLFGPGL
jgi:hypothetical protein